jgi:hypothetical protein
MIDGAATHPITQWRLFGIAIVLKDGTYSWAKYMTKNTRGYYEWIATLYGQCWVVSDLLIIGNAQIEDCVNKVLNPIMLLNMLPCWDKTKYWLKLTPNNDTDALRYSETGGIVKDTSLIESLTAGVMPTLMPIIQNINELPVKIESDDLWYDGGQCATCAHIYCGLSEHYWVELHQPIPVPCPDYRKHR